MRVVRRFIPVVSSVILFLSAPSARPAILTEASLTGKAARWSIKQAEYVEAGQKVDFAVAGSFRQQLKQEIGPLLAKLASAIGPQRAVFQESLDVHREQLAMLDRLTHAQGDKIKQLKADQQRLLKRIDGVEKRMSQLEQRVGEVEDYVSKLDARVSKLEEAMIRECLDLRHAQVLGADEFRVKESTGSSIEDHFESDNLTLDVRLMLNACSSDLTQRGLLIQLSMVTEGLEEDMSLYATFKGLRSGGTMSQLSRQEIPLTRPGYSVDGQVVEYFFPYDDLPLSSVDRIALALVVTHDGGPIYSLPDRVISCVLGQRANCRWGR